MATTKITVTVPEELAEYIRTEVDAGRFDSVSAYITRAAEQMRDIDPLDVLIASMIAEGGPPDESHQAWVDDAMKKAELASGRRRHEHAA